MAESNLYEVNTDTVLVMVVGLAGTGKSEVGRRLARELCAAYLDKDTLSRGFTEELLRLHGVSPHDRESVTYSHKVRPFEYEQLERTAVENLACGISVVTSAPYIRESRDPAWYESMLDKADDAGAGLEVVWVRSNPQAMQRYIGDRNADRDSWKRLHWDEYLAANPWDRPPTFPHSMIDNSTHSTHRAPVAQVLDLVSKWKGL